MQNKNNCVNLQTKTSTIMSNLKGRNLISITDFSREEYLQVLDIAEEFDK